MTVLKTNASLGIEKPVCRARRFQLLRNENRLGAFLRDFMQRGDSNWPDIMQRDTPRHDENEELCSSVFEFYQPPGKGAVFEQFEIPLRESWREQWDAFAQYDWHNAEVHLIY